MNDFKMNDFKQKMTSDRLSRIPKRIYQDLRIALLIKNWREILYSKMAGGTQIESIKFRSGIVLQSPPEVDLNFLFHEVWMDEIYSPPGYEIEKDNLVIDIGANIGVFASYAATRADNVKVIAFEPFPDNVDWLRKNVAESNLSNITIHPQAVGGVTEERILQISDSWMKHVLSEVTNGNNGNDLYVRYLNFSDIMNRIPKCDLLKVDCEGSEYEIFYSSSPETLKKIRRIVGEFHPRGSDGKNGRALCQCLESNGFDITHFTMLENEEGIFCATNSAPG